MCDYSLCGIPNRLAVEGEELVVHRFSTGSMGLASVVDLQVHQSVREAAPRKTFWESLKSFFEGPDQSAAVPAVCIPPGAQLILTDIPADLRRRHHLSPEELAVFTQTSAEFYSYRDAIRFQSRFEVHLQDLREGMHVRVLSLAGAPEYAPLDATMTEGVNQFGYAHDSQRHAGDRSERPEFAVSVRDRQESRVRGEVDRTRNLNA
jgi:hypothetical protein